MLTAVTDEAAIRRSQRLLARSLRACAGESATAALGFPGGGIRARVAWSDDLGIWFCSKRLADRYWNAFGTENPTAGATCRIACEINIPLAGADRRIGGAFASSPAGDVLLVHRGILGGARRGIGKGLFTERYRGVWALLADPAGRAGVAVIGGLASPRLAREVALFVQKIAGIKRSVRDAQLEIFREPRFRPESLGSRSLLPLRDLDAECARGLVAADLCAALQGLGIAAGNDEAVHLTAVDRRGSIRALFQIATSAGEEALLPEIGRLALESGRFAAPVCLVLVMPASPQGPLADRLRGQEVRVLTYRWEQQRAVFPELPLLRPDLA